MALNILGLVHSFGGHDLYPPLFLFDLIDLPSSCSINPDNELQYLSSQGIVRQSQVIVHGECNNAVVRRDAFDVYRLRDDDEPGRWSIWYLTGDDPIPPECAEPNLAFQLRLQDALLVPDPNVPIEDLLAFRERRHSELMSLRHYMDELCIKVAQSGPDLRLANVETEKMEAALSDYLRVSMEPNWKKFVMNLDIEMNWTDAVAALATASVAAPTPLNVAVAAGVGIASSMAVKSVRGIKDRTSKSPFAYIGEVHKEFGT